MSGTVEQLGAKDAERLKALLAREPVQNLYLLGLLEEFGLRPSPGQPPAAFFGRSHGRELSAALFVGGDGGLVVPSASDPGELSALASALRGRCQLRASVGERTAVDAVLKHLCVKKPRLSRTQRLFKVSADDLGPFTNPTLRLATEDDLGALVPLAAGAVRETFEQDPLELDPEGFRSRVLQRIRAKRTYVLWVGGRLVFKVDVGSRSQYGAELESLYTPPEQRRQGHATLSLGQISRHLLSSLPRLTLRVDEQDTSFAGVARKVGFTAAATMRVVVVD